MFKMYYNPTAHPRISAKPIAISCCPRGVAHCAREALPQRGSPFEFIFKTRRRSCLREKRSVPIGQPNQELVAIGSRHYLQERPTQQS